MNDNIDLGGQTPGGILSPLGTNLINGDQTAENAQQIGYSQQDVIEESRDITMALIALLAEFPILRPGIVDPDAFAAVFFKSSGITIDFNEVAPQVSNTTTSTSNTKKSDKADSEADLDNFTAMLNATRLLIENMKKNNETVSHILDKWNESIHILRDEYEKMIQSPTYQMWKEMANPTYENDLKVQFPNAFNILIANSSDLLANLNADQKAHEIDKAAQREIGLRNYLDNMVDSYTTHKSEDDAKFVMLPVMVTFVTLELGLSGNLVEKVAETSIGQSLEAVKTALPAQLVDTAILTINLFATSIMYTATVETILDSASKGEKPVTKEMAENFAKEVIKKIAGNEINGALLLLLQNKLFGSDVVTHERINQLIIIAKLMMALQALIILYKADTKWITAEELAALLKGKIPLEEHSLAFQLVTLINFYRNQLSPALQVAILSSMMNYAESKNKTKDEDTFNTLKVVQDALGDIELFDTFGIKG